MSGKTRHQRIVRLLGTPRARYFGAAVATALLGGWPGAVAASGAAVVVHEPTVLGPSGSVHHVDSGGYEAGFDWVLTQGIDNAEVNAALWEAPLAEGAYQTEVFLPKEIGDTYARYEVTHEGTISEARLRQSNFVGDQWVALGAWNFDASQASVRSSDAAGYPGEELAWSAVRFTPLASLPPNIESNGSETIINEPQVAGPEEFVVRFVGVGYRGDLLRAYARGSGATAVNSATWSVPLARGEYSVEAFIPAEHAEAEVTYEIHARDGTHAAPLMQKGYNNLWVSLGDYKFGEAGGSVSSDDATGVKEQEIAWDALRFKLIKAEPLEKEVVKEPSPQPGSSGSSEQLVAPVFGGLPVLSEVEPLLVMPPFQVKTGPRRHRRFGPADLYKLRSILVSSPPYELLYRCRPCLIVPAKLKLRPHSQIPVTRRTTRSGSLHALLGVEFYKKTLLQVQVGELGFQPLLYEYALSGGGRLAEPRICVAAAAVSGRCPP